MSNSHIWKGPIKHVEPFCKWCCLILPKFFPRYGAPCFTRQNPWPYWTALHQTTSPVLQRAVIHLLDSGTRYHSYSNRNKISPVPIWQPFNHLQPPCVPPGPQHFLSRLDIPIPWPHVKTLCSPCGHTSQSTPWWCYCSSWNTVLGTADLLAFSSKGWL